ncbi:unnamed protein product, partial [marine sediment metagenome]
MNNKNRDCNKTSQLPYNDYLFKKYIPEFCNTSRYGNKDSDQHVITLFAIALACRGKTLIEFG